MKRCKCWHGRKQCLLEKHDGGAVPHQVKATAREIRIGHHTDGLYCWNTGRIWPLLRTERRATTIRPGEAAETKRRTKVNTVPGSRRSVGGRTKGASHV